MSVDFTNPVHKKLIEQGIMKLEKDNPVRHRKGGGIKGENKLNKDDFMKIFMAEVKNQDPFKPMDAKEYGSHLAQFSQLEQLVNMNKQMTEMHRTQGNANRNEFVSYIGKEIHAQNNTFDYVPGRTIELPVNLSQDAEIVEVEIFDGKGQTVNTLNVGRNKAGSLNVKWDGSNSDGVIVKGGTFSYRPKAQNVFGNEVHSDTYLKGTVTGVEFEGEKATLLIGKTKISPEKIIGIYNRK